jgi:hypothetical protein
MTAGCQHKGLSGCHQVGEYFAVKTLDDRPGRDWHYEVRSTCTVAMAALSGLAMACAPVGVVMQIEQAVDTRVHKQDHVGTPAAIAAVGTAERFELLTMDGGTTVTAIATVGVDDHAIDEGGHRR